MVINSLPAHAKKCFFEAKAGLDQNAFPCSYSCSVHFFTTIKQKSHSDCAVVAFILSLLLCWISGYSITRSGTGKALKVTWRVPTNRFSANGFLSS